MSRENLSKKQSVSISEQAEKEPAAPHSGTAGSFSFVLNAGKHGEQKADAGHPGKEAVIFHFIELPWFVRLIAYLVPYFIVGYDVLLKAAKNIRNGQVFDECFLMSIATIGAIATGEYLEGVAVMLFYQIGELFQSIAVGNISIHKPA